MWIRRDGRDEFEGISRWRGEERAVGGGDCGRVCERVWIYGGVYETLLVVVLKKVEREVDVRLFICNLLFCVVVILI